jgi:membrane protein
MAAGRAPLRNRIEGLVWDRAVGPQPRWRAASNRLLRTLAVLVRDLLEGQLTLRAMSLVYTTLLSIVPLMALGFSVLKAFGVHNQAQPLLLRALAPLGAESAQLAARISGFIENMNVGVLGALGLGMLLYTAVSLMQKIEESLNFIWRVHQPRSLGERFSRYLSVLLVGPLLVFSALGVTASVLNNDLVRELLALGLFGEVAQFAARLVPYLLVIAAFTFVYLFIPNAQVRFGAALCGGVVGGVVWQTAGWLFALFVSSSGQYAAIYSGLAVGVLFLIWLHVSWLVLLFGASVAFYVQHPEYLQRGIGEPALSLRLQEQLALSVLVLVATRFQRGEPAAVAADLGRELSLPVHQLDGIVRALEAGQLLHRSADAPPRYLPSRDPGQIGVNQVLAVVRSAGEAGFVGPEGLPTPASVTAVLGDVQAAVDAAVAAVSVRDLVDRASRGADPR